MKGLAVVLLLLWPLQSLDDSVQRFVQSARRPALEPVMRAATDFGKPVVVFGVLLGIACFTGPAGPATARLALAAMVPTNLVVEGAKRATNRTRPDGEAKRSNSSFPSSHAANGATLAFVFTRRWPRAAWLFWLAALLVVVARVYLNRHFASDALGGAAIGIACAWAASRWLDARRHDRSSTLPSSGV